MYRPVPSRYSLRIDATAPAPRSNPAMCADAAMSLELPSEASME
jgi:hypothetical protein